MNRYLGALFLGLCLSSTALVGCGDDSSEDDGEDGNTTGAKPGTVNEAGTASVVSASTTAIGYLGTGDGASAALSFAAVGTGAFALITPSSGQTQSLEAPTVGTASSGLCEESCTGDATSGSCTFSGCTLGDAATGSWTVEGTVGWTTTHLDCDISYSGDFSGFTYAMNIFCDVDYTPTSLDGTVRTDGNYTATANGQTVESDWDANVTYNDVVFPEGGGCPTSGSVDLDASITVNNQTYEGAGSVTFPNASCAG